MLGAGAYGKVYLAKDSKSQNKNDFVAVKILENKDLSDDFMKASFKNELEIL